MRNLAMTLNLGKKLNDNGFGMFREQLENKLREKGSVLVRTNRFYPSTKTCHCCGSINPEIKLGVSRWVCPNCKTLLDRDVNAAINIRNEGIRNYKSILGKEER